MLHLPVLGNQGALEKPREVQIRVIFLRIGDIDTLNEKFYAEILIESKWEEPKLKAEFETPDAKNKCRAPSNASNFPSFLNASTTFQKEEREFANANKYWNPQIYVENVLNDPKQQVFYKIKKEPINHHVGKVEEEDSLSRSGSCDEGLDKPSSSSPTDDNDVAVAQLNHKSGDNFSYWIYEYRKMKGSFFEKLELNYFPVRLREVNPV